MPVSDNVSSLSFNLADTTVKFTESSNNKIIIIISLFVIIYLMQIYNKKYNN